METSKDQARVLERMLTTVAKLGKRRIYLFTCDHARTSMQQRCNESYICVSRKANYGEALALDSSKSSTSGLVLD